MSAATLTGLRSRLGVARRHLTGIASDVQELSQGAAAGAQEMGGAVGQEIGGAVGALVAQDEMDAESASRFVRPASPVLTPHPCAAKSTVSFANPLDEVDESSGDDDGDAVAKSDVSETMAELGYMRGAM